MSWSNKKKRAPERPEERPRALRVGIIQNGKIVEERWFRKELAVTIGAHSKNTFLVEELDLPARFPLFQKRKDGYFMQLPEEITGHIMLENRRVSLTQIERIGRQIGTYSSKADPQKQRQVYELPLQDVSRGKLQLGSTILLFQLTTPPPQPAVAQVLPRALAGSWRQGVDWAYASIITLSFLAHSSLVYWLQQLGPLPKNAVYGQNLSARVQTPLYVVPRAPKPAKPSPRKGPEKASKKDPGDKPKPRPKKSRRGDKKGKKPQAVPRPSPQRAVRNIGILQVLTSKGKGKGSPFSKMLDNSSFRELDRSLRKLGGVDVSDAGRLRLHRRRLKDQKLSLKQALIGGALQGKLKLRQSGSARRRATKISKKHSKILLEFSPPTVSGKLDGRSLKQTIRRNYHRIKYCYERVIKTAGHVQGKVTIELKIDPRGRAGDFQVVDDQLRNRKVTRCLIRRLRSFRFPKPKDGPVTVELPFVFSRSG